MTIKTDKMTTKEFDSFVSIQEKLLKAKENVIWLLKNSDGSVDMHGLVYWAGVVENLREKIKEVL